jgi:alpha-mannosidase
MFYTNFQNMEKKVALPLGNPISRRSFINQSTAGTAILAFGPVTSLIANPQPVKKTWPAGASAFRFYMIGNAHIDPVWLWPWSEGIAVVHSTFRSALDRMNETPGFIFTASSAQFFRWVADNDPKMFEEIKKRVDEGRFAIVGGWWVEPDLNMPCGESLVRQGLYGQRTFQELLGRRARVASNPDSFGHTGNLPQILKQQGMENYVFMRPQKHEKTIPSDLFWWEGSDGTRVLTYRIQLSYNDEESVQDRIQAIMTQGTDQPMKDFIAYYGVGDHGGGATKENIQSIEAIKKEKGAPVIFYSSPENYFSEIRKNGNKDIPVVKEDLQHHAVGCYTADTEIKKGVRQSEAALITAEKISAIGSSIWNAAYPKKELTTAWQRLLFLQFHDSMAGTSLFEHTLAARNGFGYAMDIASQATILAVQKLEWQVAAKDPDSQYLILFNPHAWEVDTNIEYDLDRTANLTNSRVEDEQGHTLLHQWTAGYSEAGNRSRLVVNTRIPSLGYRQIRIFKGENPTAKTGIRAESNLLENEFIRLHISEEGTIGLYDKENGKEVFTDGESGCRAIVIDDPSDTWSHDVKSYSKEIGVFGDAKIFLIENGPLRASIRVITHYGDSTLQTDWTLYSGARNVEAKVMLDWHEQLKMLKFSFPVDVVSPVATYETSYATIIRETNGNEDPGQRWLDVSGKSGADTYGLTVFNDAKYGYSVPDNDLRISVARAAVYAHHIPRVLDAGKPHYWMDQGIQTFRMLLVPHKDSWQQRNIPRIAEEFMHLPIVMYQGIHGGSMPPSGSFAAVDAPGIIISGIKKAEEGEAIIFRCVEALGQPVIASVDIKFAGQKWTGSFRAYEIKSLWMDLKAGLIKEVNLLEE